MPAKEAQCGWPMGVVRQIDGDIIVNDHNCHRIWRIDADGILHTLAGDGVPGNTGDGGPAIDARLNTPYGLRFYGEDILLIVEHVGHHLRAAKIA